MTTNTNIPFEDWEAERMQDPEFRSAAEALEPAYQVARLRIMRGLTQEQLAELAGTKQSSIARLESGNTQPRLSFLRRIVEALGGRLEVRIMSQEEATAPARPSISTADQSEAYSKDKIIYVPNWPQSKRHFSYLDDHASAASL
jgi:transcriptional regulator with XRE-family HTH domain